MANLSCPVFAGFETRLNKSWMFGQKIAKSCNLASKINVDGITFWLAMNGFSAATMWEFKISSQLNPLLEKSLRM